MSSEPKKTNIVEKQLRILVTGGLGTIGRPLCTELRRRGHQVVACDLAHHHSYELGFHWVHNPTTAVVGSYARCDVGDYRQLERVFTACGPFDLVYHAAAEFGRWNGEDFYEQVWRTNAIGTKHVIRMCERYGSRLVFFSSSEIYGNQAMELSENITQFVPLKQLGDYALSKWVGEQQLRNSSLWDEGRAVIIRLFNTYGPGEYFSPYRSFVCRFLYAALAGEDLVVHLGHRRTMLWIEDAIRALANLVDCFKPRQCYNLADTEFHRIEDVANTIVDIIMADPALIKLHGPEPRTVLSKVPDVRLARDDLGLQRTMEPREGLRWTAIWMRGIYFSKTCKETTDAHR